MHCVSRAIVWVRRVLFGPPHPDYDTARDTAVPATPTTLPGLSLRTPSPEMWAAILASARRRRTSRPWPPTVLPAISADDITSTLVGTYLLAPEVHQRARAAARFAEEACR